VHTTNLRKVGGSVMLAVPPAILDLLQLKAGSAVAISVDAGRLVVHANPPRRATLEELIAQCDPNAPLPEEREWVDAPAAGRELI
jgi:antitoxin ChpS